jgi:hypothetical protein
MTYKIYDYVDAQGRNIIKDWTLALQKPQRAKLNAMLDKLALHGDTLYPNMLAGTRVSGVSKLKVHGNVQLRPLLCKGPVDIHGEYTLLAGAKEVGDDWKPADAPEKALQHKEHVKREPDKRRKEHEFVS